MTTILGIKIEDVVIMAADRQLNVFYGDQPTEKSEIEKIIKYKNALVASTGPEDNDVNMFFTCLKQGSKYFDKFSKSISKGKSLGPFEVYSLLIKAKQEYKKNKVSLTEWDKKFLQYVEEDSKPRYAFTQYMKNIGELIFNRNDDLIAEALDNGYFLELDLLNRMFFAKVKKESKSNISINEATELIIASTKPEVGLYYVDFQGIVIPSDSDSSKPLEYICLGSGSEYAEVYIDNKDFEDDKKISAIKKEFDIKKINVADLSVEEGICIAYGALIKASRDTFTSENYDLIVVDNNGFFDIGEIIKNRKKQAEKEGLIEGIRKYSKTRSKNNSK